MLNKIIAFSIKNKLVVGFFTLLLIGWGAWSATKLPIDALPDITNNQVQIITVTPTLATQEVEQFITYPIEKSLANLPDLVEMRSVSRFGLSVITVVFEEKVDIYFARQQINEKLKEAEEELPEGVGKPELGPVSTGLGEIYQYALHPTEGSEDKYSAMELRTMQDWIVARQLYGTPGVAEVNSFGGYLKQYEVAIDPSRLRAMGISINDIFEALESNNQNTGGAYIDKKPNAYFIRGIGLITSIEDIRNIPIQTTGDVPLFIGDVATVDFGHATRYGAFTYNGEKEAVGGMVMMLKDANTAEVVKNVKEKIEVIQKSLPDDIVIEPFLDRTDLINRAIRTVETNLVEGALIVVFVLVLFLGNLRAGLIVASAIPLSLLFALGMMRVFGVSANLMSLGAIDFGLIVDGAVIIVEATMHHLGLRKNRNSLTQQQMDHEVYLSASKIRKSAAFGEIIILIVYLPILTLVGIEGKMFGPMAQTVGFAILGAFLLSFTYIPMVSALFLSKKVSDKRNFSDKMMAYLQKLYMPVIKKMIRIKYIVVVIAASIFIFSLFLFSRLGGEFIPQLQEGDFAMHCILPQGSSLSQSIETSMQAERILKTFPEVKTVVGKTGSAEIPTDPMPLETTDLIITLKPKNEWADKKSYEQLASEMMEKLEVIPGVFFEVSQPIQMRFNELMTGVRQDVAVKIFGENIDTLASLAPKVAAIIQSVEGATDPGIERVSGLPQINVDYDRNRMANYKLTVDEVNQSLRTAFAGEKAGVVFEDERKFDLVVRLDSIHRSSIDDVGSLLISIPNGNQIPLSQVATVSLKEGPAQITREDGKRRIVVGFNVKDRDVESVVEEIQKKLDESDLLPQGYYYTYGGNFQNLKEASDRLMIAVPLALLLIFALLYFTFHSVTQALLIFTAIPLSAIGGVLALMVRDMPFSISAGVGFIALFGVAVLNGIVLIATFNQLEKDGFTNILHRVLKGTKIRLRPVLMTASVASLGFLPMALSQGAGAEVQKPLATVVIGGLITATLLTLIVIPCLYIIFSGKKKIKMNPKLLIALVVSLCAFTLPTLAQQTPKRLSLQAAIDTALTANLQFTINDAQMKKAGFDVKSSSQLAHTGFFVENDDYRPDDNGELKIGISQDIQWPGLYAARKEYYNNQLKSIQLDREVLTATIKRDVRQAYYELWYLQDKEKLLIQLDSIFTEAFQAAKLRYSTGEVAELEMIATEVKMNEMQAFRKQNDQDIALLQQQLMVLLNKDERFVVVDQPLEKIHLAADTAVGIHPTIAIQQQNTKIAESEIKIQRNTNMPNFSVRAFSQKLYGVDNPLSGFSVTMGIPLFGAKAAKNRVRAAEAQKDVEKQKLGYQVLTLKSRQEQAYAEMQKQLAMVQFYEDSGLRQAKQIITSSSLSYRSGEIGFSEFSEFLTQAVSLRESYLKVLNAYNQAQIDYLYLINQ